LQSVIGNSRPVCKLHPLQYASLFKKQDENTHEEKLGLLTQAVSASQQVVWATGTHTSTLVFVFVKGEEQIMRPFAKILHHTQLAIDALQ